MYVLLAVLRLGTLLSIQALKRCHIDPWNELMNEFVNKWTNE